MHATRTRRTTPPRRPTTQTDPHPRRDATTARPRRQRTAPLPARTALASGLRIGEALGLIVADLDAEQAIIRVSHQLGRDGNRTPLKTAESQRALDIPPELMRRLLALVTERGARFNPDAFVFASRNNTGLERKTARGVLDRAVKNAGLAAPKPTLHDLRHSHASMLIALGYDLVAVQHRLGHRKPDTTLRIYTHQWAYRDAQKSQIGATPQHAPRTIHPLARVGGRADRERALGRQGATRSVSSARSNVDSCGLACAPTPMKASKARPRVAENQLSPAVAEPLDATEAADSEPLGPSRKARRSAVVSSRPDRAAARRCHARGRASLPRPLPSGGSARQEEAAKERRLVHPRCGSSGPSRRVCTPRRAALSRSPLERCVRPPSAQPNSHRRRTRTADRPQRTSASHRSTRTLHPRDAYDAAARRHVASAPRSWCSDPRPPRPQP